MSAGRDLDRSARQTPAVGRRLLHVHGPGDPPVDRFPGGLGLRVRRATRRARALPDLRAGGRRDAADRVRLVVLDLVVDLRDRRRGPRVPARLVRGPDQHARRHDPRRVRDRGVHRPRDLADRGRRERQRPRGLRHQLRHGAGVRRGLGGDRRVRLHDLGVHRVRGGGAARGGGEGSAPDDRASRDPVVHRDRCVLRAHDVRGGRVLRARPVLRVPDVRRRQPLGRTCTCRVGRRLGPDLPRDRELGHRQLERELERGHPDVVRDGQDPAPAGDARPDAPGPPFTARRGVRPVRDRGRRRAVARRPVQQPVPSVRDPRARSSARS